MHKNWIKNFKELATSKNRELALHLVEAGLDAINTKAVVFNSIKLEGDILKIQDKDFDLNNFKKIKIVGFGKASCDAVLVLEEILGDRIIDGTVIGPDQASCKYVEIFAGTHPRPSKVNVQAGEKIYQILDESNEEDLVLVIVSGGGSALLNYPESEYIQGAKLYDAFLKCGQTINEINTIRKHLSLLKGGGLAKVAYPATVVGLVFSDIPGNHFENVASGPTYKDETTIADAQKIIDGNNLGAFDLIETPKEDKYFEKVNNFVLVSNEVAVKAMAKKAEELSLQTDIISTELYDEIDKALEKIFSAQKDDSVVLAAGELCILVKEGAGKGGRNLHTGLQALKNKMIDEDSVFVSFTSDGRDNSDVAGVIVDKDTVKKTEELGLDVGDYLERFDSYSFFEKTGDAIVTGRTGANVSDLMFLLTKNSD